jgi:hypothetical protein
MADQAIDLASRIYGLLDTRVTYNGDQFIAETARLIHKDRAAVREATLREAIEAVERALDANALRDAKKLIEELITGGKTHG